MLNICGLDLVKSVMLLLSLPGKFLGIVGQEPSDFKSNMLHVDIL